MIDAYMAGKMAEHIQREIARTRGLRTRLHIANTRMRRPAGRRRSRNNCLAR